MLWYCGMLILFWYIVVLWYNGVQWYYGIHQYHGIMVYIMVLRYIYFMVLPPVLAMLPGGEPHPVVVVGNPPP